MKKKYLLIFSSDDRYIACAQRLHAQATSLGWFDKVITYGISVELKNFVPECVTNDFTSLYPRGFGLWAWKPDFILYCLENLIEEGSIVVYLDAGVELNQHGVDKFETYCNVVHDSKIVVSRTKKFEFLYSNIKLMRDFKLSIVNIFSYQYQATILMLPNEEKFRSLIKSWKKYCLFKNGLYLTNSSILEGIVGGNRHDQSVLSAILKKMPSIVYSTGIPFAGIPSLINKSKYMMSYPFFSLRNYTSNLLIDSNITFRPSSNTVNKFIYLFTKAKYKLSRLLKIIRFK